MTTKAESKPVHSTAIKKQFFTKQIRAIAALCSDPARQGEHVRKVMGTLMTLWTARVAPGLPAEEFVPYKGLAAASEVNRFVDWLCTQDILEGAYWLSTAYSIWTGDDYRKQLAMYFTPPSLTKRLLDDLEAAGASFAEHSFFDPACGGAAFLAPIAQRIKVALKAQGKKPIQIIRHIEEQIFGLDLDVVLCQMSKQFLRVVLADEIQSSGITPHFRVNVGNSLADTCSVHGTFDVIVCNPPYRKMPTQEVEQYRAEYGHVIDAQPNLYGLFWALGLKLLKPQGLAGFVTPTSFMSGRYFSKLRTHLIEHAEIASIGLVSDRAGVFIDVEQETALTLVRRREPEQLNNTAAQVSVVSRHGILTSVGDCALPSGGAAWPIPRAEGDAELISIIGKSPYRLADYGVVARTGLFVWNRDPRKTYFQISDAQKDKAQAILPLLWSSDITKEGVVAFGNNKKHINEPSFVDIGTMEAAGIIRHPSVLLQRVTSNDQPLRLVAGVVPETLRHSYGGFVGENHLIVLESTTAMPLVPHDLLAKLLGSRPVDRYFRCISGSTNVSIFELQQLPLPEPSRLRQLLQAGLLFEQAVLEAYQ